VKSEMKYAMKSYCMEFYFKTDPDGNFFWGWGWVGMSSRSMFRLRKVFFLIYCFYLLDAGEIADWNFDLHDLQLCFGVNEFLVCLMLRLSFHWNFNGSTMDKETLLYMYFTR